MNCALVFQSKPKKAFQLLSLQFLIYVRYEETPVATTSWVFDETELNDADEQCFAHDYNFGNYSSLAIPDKKSGDASVKAQKPSTSAKKGNI